MLTLAVASVDEVSSESSLALGGLADHRQDGAASVAQNTPGKRCSLPLSSKSAPRDGFCAVPAFVLVASRRCPAGR